MSNVPKPPAPRGTGPSAPPAAVPQTPPDSDRLLGPGSPVPQRLQRALGVFGADPTTPSSVQGLLSGYVRFANPNMTTEHLPRSLKPHHIHRERAASGGTKYDAFFFLVGNAIAGMQDAYAKDRLYAAAKTAKDKAEAKIVVLAAIQLMESRVARLETLAKAGQALWHVSGTDAEGFTLLTEAEADAKRNDELAAYQRGIDAQRAEDEANDQAEQGDQLQ